MPLRPNGQGDGLNEDRAARAFAQQMATADAPHGEESGTILHRQEIREWLLRQHELVATWQEFYEASRGEPDLLDWPAARPRPTPRGVIEAFVKTCQRWRLNEDEQAVLLGYGTNPPLAREMMSGRYGDLPQDVRDRVGYIVGISVGLGAVFDEAVQAELDWLHRPHPKLANRAPLSVMLMGHMAQLITVSDLVAEERALR
jgi:Protein of unknown function (DUF2384)